MESAPPGAPGRFRLKEWGTTPVLTFGRPGKAMILNHNGKPILSLAMEDGTWELEIRDGAGTLVCDTGGIRGTLLGTSITTTQSIAIAAGPAHAPLIARPVAPPVKRPDTRSVTRHAARPIARKEPAPTTFIGGN